MTAKIPATVITGFLGVGKSTLIRHVLQNANGRRLALIVNEFGDVGIDGDLLRGCGIEGCADDDVLELANGCICCTVADDFLPTMQTLLARDPAPEHIIIETSGLALPQPLVQAFNWPEIKTRVTVDGVVAVIDAAAVSEGRFAGNEQAVQEQRRADQSVDHDTPLGELFEDQLACADMIVLNKVDLVGGDGLALVRQVAADHARPAARLVESSHGALSPEVLLGLGMGAEDDMAPRYGHHGPEDHHEHDHDDFISTAFDLPEIADRERFAEALRMLAAETGLLRLKGFLAVSGKPMRWLVQGVGPRLDHHFDRHWLPEENRRGQLVVIAEKTCDFDALGARLMALDGLR